MWLRNVLSLTFAVLFAAAMSSCKAPTASTQQTADLTLIVSDSTRLGDVTLLHTTSQIVQNPSWRLEWNFGDGESVVGRDTTMIHRYRMEGTFHVSVTLKDTAKNQTIASVTRTIHIVALQFDPTALKGFTKVSIEGYGIVKTDWAGSSQGQYSKGSSSSLDSLKIEFENVIWNGYSFHAAFSRLYLDTSYGYVAHARGSGDSLSGTISSALTSIQSILAKSWDSNYTYLYPNLKTDGQGNSSLAQCSEVHFETASDTDIVFEESSPLAATAFFSKSSDQLSRTDWLNSTSSIEWADTSTISKIIIRFHN